MKGAYTYSLSVLLGCSVVWFQECVGAANSLAVRLLDWSFAISQYGTAAQYSCQTRCRRRVIIR